MMVASGMSCSWRAVGQATRPCERQTTDIGHRREPEPIRALNNNSRPTRPSHFSKVSVGGDDRSGRGSGGSGRPGVGVVADLGWDASDGCAGFPPSRERRGGGARTTSFAKVPLRGEQEWASGGSGRRGWGLLATLVGMRVTVALGSRLRGNDVGEARERPVLQRSPYAGTTGVGVGAAGAGDRGGGCCQPWLGCE